MKTRGFESLEVYRLAERLADEIWNCVTGWGNLAKDTVGKQIIRAADSVGANLAEGSGRGTYQDNRRFIRMGKVGVSLRNAALAATRLSATVDRRN